MQLFTHGTITGLLFLAVGIVYEKAHTRYIPDLGGLAGRMPFVAAAMLIAGLASLGLPGLSGFVSELLVFLGAFRAYDWPTVLAVLGIVLGSGLHPLDDGANILRGAARTVRRPYGRFAGGSGPAGPDGGVHHRHRSLPGLADGRVRFGP